MKRLSQRVARLEAESRNLWRCPTCSIETLGGFEEVDGQYRGYAPAWVTPWHLATEEELEFVTEAASNAPLRRIEFTCKSCSRSWIENEPDLPAEDVERLVQIRERLWALVSPDYTQQAWEKHEAVMEQIERRPM